jgi:hypothetical protein
MPIYLPAHHKHLRHKKKDQNREIASDYFICCRITAPSISNIQATINGSLTFPAPRKSIADVPINFCFPPRTYLIASKTCVPAKPRPAPMDRGAHLRDYFCQHNAVVRRDPLNIPPKIIHPSPILRPHTTAPSRSRRCLGSWKVLYLGCSFLDFFLPGKIEQSGRDRGDE